MIVYLPIRKNKYDLKYGTLIPGDGNCWYASCSDQMEYLKMDGLMDPSQLRLAVTSRMKDHPNRMQWIRTLYGGRAREYNKFVREQACDGSFIDNHGISAIITADILDILINLVGTSNDGKNPVTVIGSTGMV